MCFFLVFFFSFLFSRLNFCANVQYSSWGMVCIHITLFWNNLELEVLFRPKNHQAGVVAWTVGRQHCASVFVVRLCESRRSDDRHCFVYNGIAKVEFLHGPRIPIPYPPLVRKSIREITMRVRPSGQKWASWLAMEGSRRFGLGWCSTFSETMASMRRNLLLILAFCLQFYNIII